MKSSNEKLSKGLVLQFIALIVLIVLVVLTLFIPEVLPYADFVAGITFIIIGYNKINQPSKALSYFCYIFGVVFIIMGGWTLFNG